MDDPPPAPDEALAAIRGTAELTRRALAAASLAPLLILWGVAILAGFLWTYWRPDLAGTGWAVVDGAAAVATIIVLIRQERRGPVHSASDRALTRRVMALWLATAAFGLAWVLSLAPLDGRQVGLFALTLAMFVYVVMGLWLASRPLLVVGVAVAGLVFAGYFLLGPVFHLWAGLAGGGGLIAGGLVQTGWRRGG